MVRSLINFILHFLLLACFFFSLSACNKAKKCNINAVTYSSIAENTNVGNQLKKKFLESTGCNLNLFSPGSSLEIITHLKVTGVEKYDAVIGLEMQSIEKFIKLFPDAASVKYSSSFNKSGLTHPILHKAFFPITWSPLTILTKKKLNSYSFKTTTDFLNSLSMGELLVQNEKRSSLGAIFFKWFKLGNKNNVDPQPSNQNYKKIKVFPGWSSSYKFFKLDTNKFIHTFWTSLNYHHIFEKNLDIKPIYIESGHPSYVEYITFISKKPHNKLLLNFFYSQEVQELLEKENFMLSIFKEKSEIKGHPFPRLL